MIRALALCTLLTACSPTAPKPGNEADAASNKGTTDVDQVKLPWTRLRGVKPIELTPDTARWQRLGVKTAHAFLGESPDVLLVVYELADAQALLAAKDELLAIDPPADALQVRRPPAFHRKAAWSGAWLLIAGLPAEKPPSPEMEAARDAYLRGWSVGK